MRIHIIIIALLLMLFSNKAYSQITAVYVYSNRGESATLKASLQTASQINNPVYKWYNTPTGSTVISNTDTYITPSLNSDAVYYVSVEGTDYCEGTRLAVNVIIAHDIEICSGETVTMAAALQTAGLIANPEYKWYDVPTGGTAIGTNATFTSTPLMSDTTFYVSVEGDDYCDGWRKKINVRVLPCADMVKKSATLLPNTFAQNGTYANPVSILGNEVVKYEITVVNQIPFAANIIIVDTLPAYLEHVGDATAIPLMSPGTSITSSNTSAPPHPTRQILTWEFYGISSNATVTALFNASPVAGAVASQPLFINRAMVSIAPYYGDTIHIQTNSTYHQGAGISITTFSAGFGGSIYNAGEQALDYMSAPLSGIIIAPEEGYKFAGWSHDGYTSLRGAAIEAQEGIMHYDTLIIYGHVELHANFVPMEASLDDEQEEDVTAKSLETEDKVWTVKDELYMQVSKVGSVVRIHTLDGNLSGVRTIVSPSISKMKLPRGIYIVTINNRIGQKVRIE